MFWQGYQERANDREASEGDIFLTESEKRTILELNRQYRKFLLVLNVGGVVDLFACRGSGEYSDPFAAGRTDRKRSCRSCSWKNISFRQIDDYMDKMEGLSGFCVIWRTG